MFHLDTLYAFSGMFWYRCYSRQKNLQWEVLAIHKIPSKFPSQIINSSKNKTKQKKKRVSLAAWKSKEGSLEQTYVMDKDGISVFVGHRSDDEAYSSRRSWQKQRLKTSDTPRSKSCAVWPCHHGRFDPLAAPHDRPQLRNLWSAPPESGSSRLQPCGRTLSALPVSQISDIKAQTAPLSRPKNSSR